jgi:probable HAF family extracellular repeat protein
MSDDGHTIVGACSTGGSAHAYLWRPNLGMADLNTYLPALGLALTGWELGAATGANADGTVIVGVGTHNNQLRAWLVRGLPEFCYPDCNADGSLTVADFGCFQTQFVASHPYADCNSDGALTVQDFGCFQSKFVVGCP